MAELKTKPTSQPPEEFLNTIKPEQKKQDGLILLERFKKVTGEEPVMWGSSIVGFGSYHYKSERSSQEGDWPLVAFSPRNQKLSLYIMQGIQDDSDLEKLGKHKASIGCLYINKLADVDMQVLEKLIKKAYNAMRKRYD